ncbi:MAG: zf-HC2 domain-containing protein [Tuberibacillus sp.]
MAEHVKELLSAYLDNELNDEDTRRVHEHLRNCEECRDSLYELQLLKDNIFYAYENIDVPVNLEASIMDRIFVMEQDASPKNDFAVWVTGAVAFVIMASMAAFIAPVMYFIARFTYKLASIGFTVLHTVPIVVSAIPYLSYILYGGAIILIAISSWLLYRLLLSNAYDRRELL